MREPIDILKSYSGKEVTVNCKKGFDFKGTLLLVDDNNNILLGNCTILRGETEEKTNNSSLINGQNITHIQLNKTS